MAKMQELASASLPYERVPNTLQYTLKRNSKATLFQWKIHGLLFKVLNRDNELSCFQETLMNSTKHYVA